MPGFTTVVTVNLPTCLRLAGDFLLLDVSLWPWT